MTFQELVTEELAAARVEHPPHSSLHESHSVILEEFEEFWDEVKKKHRCKSRILAELVQVAAMCQRCAEDLELIDEYRQQYIADFDAKIHELAK